VRRSRYCRVCHRLTSQLKDGGEWCCQRCGHAEREGRLVFVVLSSPTTSRTEDVWVEAVFSTLELAVAYLRRQLLAPLFWIEPFVLDEDEE